MKRLILSGVAFLAFSVAIAQNQASLSQVGTQQTSTQNQTGANLNSSVTQGDGTNTSVNTYNTSFTDQSGSTHNATVNQTGNANYNQATIVQSTGGGAPNSAIINQQNDSGGSSYRSTSPGLGDFFTGNYAITLQEGAGNGSIISQSFTSAGNYGSVVQFGNNNTQADIIQSDVAFGNSSQIFQGEDGSPVAGNKALITQQSVGSFNEARITQTGDNNTASILETDFSTLNQATINQQGSNSTAQIEQRFFSSINTASIIQTGDNNRGTIEQNTASTGNVADLFQSGNNNLNTSIQQNNLSLNNRATLNQYGNNNNQTRITQSNNSRDNQATIDMGGDGPLGLYPNGWTPVNGGTAIIEQSTNSFNNIARIGQSGDGHDARIYQNGNVSDNQAYIDQYPAAAGNTGRIEQTNQSGGTARILQNQNSFTGGTGGNNIALILQGSSAYGMSTDNFTLVTQDNYGGVGNISRNEQLGSNNVAIITQFGDGNVLAGLGSDPIARQIGSNNQMYITQSGIGNMAHVSQIGTGNLAIINQTGN